MEQRIILAFVLSFALLFGYSWLVQHYVQPPRPLSPPSAKTEEQKTPQKPPQPKLPPPQPARGSEPSASPREVSFTTPFVRASVSNIGGRVTRWELLKYQKRDQQGIAVPLPLVVDGLLAPQGLVVRRTGEPANEPAFQLTTAQLSEARPVDEVILTRTDRYALESTEILRISRDGYSVEAVLRVKNLHSSPQSAEFDLSWRTQWPDKEAARDWGQRPTGVVEKADGQVHRTELKAIQESSKEGQWIALESKWYLIAFIPQTQGIRLLQGKTPEGAVDVGLRFSPPPLAPGQDWEGRAILYIGPKEYDRLKEAYAGLEETIHYGNFLVPFLPMEWFSVPLLWLLKLFFRFSSNYGVAIILLTIIIKVIFYPFSHISMKSMKAMQSLQPQINALRAKYKNDRQRLQQETMELYRKHRINPMGGCLPMLVQVPIFYALYLTLDLSVELQGAGFLCFGRFWGVDLWICDLSKADPIYVLPILMGASWFIQQRMTPTVGDPMQAKMMMLMPIVFTFMFFSFPAGLVLYWFVNNILSIAQQLYTDRKAAKA